MANKMFGSKATPEFKMPEGPVGVTTKKPTKKGKKFTMPKTKKSVVKVPKVKY